MHKNNNGLYSSKNPRNGIVHIKNNHNTDDSYYPQECYLEDFEIEKIDSLKFLENFKPIDGGN
jgi:hypothetical protein